MGPFEVLSIQVRVGLGAMPIKRYSAFLQHYWSLGRRLFSVIDRTLIGWALPRCRDVVDVF